MARTDSERAARQVQLQQAEADRAAAVRCRIGSGVRQVAASLRSAGRKPAARANDALIAGCAIAHDLPVYTCNPEDFMGIDGLRVRAVPHPEMDVARKE